jgi:hypothetical protein
LAVASLIGPPSILLAATVRNSGCWTVGTVRKAPGTIATSLAKLRLGGKLLGPGVKK